MADLIDLGIVGLGVLVVVFGWSALLFLVRRGDFQVRAPGGLAIFALGWGIAVVYLWIGWSSTGRTVGKQIMGLRVVDGGGTLLSPPLALLRALFCAAFPVGLLWCAVSRENRSVQDLVLRSVVVHDWQHHPPERARRDPAAEEPQSRVPADSSQPG